MQEEKRREKKMGANKRVKEGRRRHNIGPTQPLPSTSCEFYTYAVSSISYLSVSHYHNFLHWLPLTLHKPNSKPYCLLSDPLPSQLNPHINHPLFDVWFNHCLLIPYDYYFKLILRR